MRRPPAALILLTLLASPAFADDAGADSLRMLDQAMIVRSVVARCAGPDAAQAAAFQTRYQDVTARARIALKSLSSDLTQAHIQSIMDDHYDEIDRHVIAIIGQESCDGFHIKEALRKYDSIINSAMSQQIAKKVD